MPERTTLRITDLAREDRLVRIGLSDGRTLELAVESLPPALPSVGETLPPELAATLELAAERKQIAKVVFRLLDRRLWTRRDLARKLKERGFDETAVAAVLDRFSAEGLMSDRRFAQAWCRDTLRAKAVGRRYLVSKLIAKGVAASLAEEVVAQEQSADDESAAARTAAVGWWRRQQAPCDTRQQSRAVRFLISRGFSPAVAGTVVRETMPQGEVT